jgi:prepilin-type N-terminal cleavage/methylation domain-containing protein
MKRVGKSSKKGFTLVELIVVLVILAILAAMLVPALTGYIRRARQEKEYQAASEILVAAQALATEYYGTTTDNPPTAAGAVAYIKGKNAANIARVQDLTGLTEGTGYTLGDITVDGTTWTVTKLVVTIGAGQYTWNGSTWTAATPTTNPYPEEMQHNN